MELESNPFCMLGFGPFFATTAADLLIQGTATHIFPCKEQVNLLEGLSRGLWTQKINKRDS